MATFPTPEPIAVTIEANFAEVQVVASDRADTVVDVRPTDPDDRAHVQVAEATRVELLGDQLRVTAPTPSLMSRILNSPSIDIAISLPTGSAVRADLGAGNVEATGTLGHCTVHTGAGNIRLEDTGARMARSAGQLITTGKVRSIDDQVARWAAVDQDAATAVIRDVLTADPVVVTVGPGR